MPLNYAQNSISQTQFGVGNPPVNYRFMVTFLTGGVFPNPFDIRFQKVSGLKAETDVTELHQGGENLSKQKLPNCITYPNLVLTRGTVLMSPLNDEFNVAMTLFKYGPSHVMVTPMTNTPMVPAQFVSGVANTPGPSAAWVFYQAWPVNWSLSDFDGTANNVLIETMELAYERFQVVRL